MVDSESPQRGQSGSVPAEFRDVSFPVSIRGYERQAVDDYVQRVNRVIAELEMSHSKEAAVKQALDRVGEQTSGILQHARASAEEITAEAQEEAEEVTARARAEAERFVANARAEAAEVVGSAKSEAGEILARSRADAAERLEQSEEEVAALREQADAWMSELHAETEAISETRRKLLTDIGELARRFQEVASWAAARFPREVAEGAQTGSPEGEVQAEARPVEVRATQEPAAAPRD